MPEYITRAATAWFLGFFPMFEIYVAVPAALAMGLDYGSAVFWSVLGNFLAVPVVLLFSDQLRRVERIDRWFERRKESRFQPMLNRYGAVVVLLATPMTGAWAMAVLAEAAGMNRFRLLTLAAVSIIVYAVVIAVAIGVGVSAFA